MISNGIETVPTKRTSRPSAVQVARPPADERLDGKPMWESYLDEVDAVLAAALDIATLAALLNEE